MRDLQNQPTTHREPDYNEFYDPRLVALYNTVCPLDGYEQFYIRLAERIGAKTVIDVGCGTGLVTNALAALGYEMTGVEPSALMLEVARKSPFASQITWIEGDARVLKEGDADLAIMTGHVAQFHLDDAYWLEALASIRRALRPGGYLVFESRNPTVQPWASARKQDFIDWYTPGFRRQVTDPAMGPLEIWLEVVDVDQRSVTTDIHYLIADSGEELLSRNTLVFRSREELSASLDASGFTIENVYGNWDGSVAREDSPELIFVARRSS